MNFYLDRRFKTRGSRLPSRGLPSRSLALDLAKSERNTESMQEQTDLAKSSTIYYFSNDV